MLRYFRRRRDERMKRLIAEAWRDEWDRLLAEKDPRVQVALDGQAIVRSIREYKRRNGEGGVAV